VHPERYGRTEARHVRPGPRTSSGGQPERGRSTGPGFLRSRARSRGESRVRTSSRSSSTRPGGATPEPVRQRAALLEPTRRRETRQQLSPVRLAADPHVQQGDDAAVGPCPDEAAESLPQRERSLGKLVAGERLPPPPPPPPPPRPPRP